MTQNNDILEDQKSDKTIVEYGNIVPQHLHYFHAGKLRDVKMYEAEDCLSECYQQLFKRGIKSNFQVQYTINTNG